ncbi:DUF1592 domain-containing protein [Cerasicoccus fimbriatus]|uniref:DUF1592 domain-containing protein n=1 Tax=Cerasicoccus fimbriatus TaxID=3014554 RepID=UPI0022B47B56|nr:DUF1592 domain-containing protein [Cerasicoccus sp. TK19100]
MSRSPTIASLLLLAAAPLCAAGGDAFAAGETLSWHDTRMLMAEYCFDCHGGFLTEGGVDLVQTQFERTVAETPEKWEKVVKALRIHYMPPLDHREMPPEHREALLRAVDARLLQVAEKSTPDHETLRRLNRYEFANTLNDLLLVDFPAREQLPGDDTGYGFDNNADVLKVSPLLLERYLSLAADAAEWAVPLPAKTRADRYAGSMFDGSGGDRGSGQSVYASGMEQAAKIDLSLPARGVYRVKLHLAGDQAGDEPVRARVHGLGEAQVVDAPSADIGAPTMVELEFSQNQPGERRLAVELANDFYDEHAPPPNDRNLVLVAMELEGPFQTEADLMTPFLERHFGGLPEAVAPAQMRQGIQRFASRAFRRPVTGEELNSLWMVYQQELKRTDNDPRRALHAVMDTVMASPNFIYRVEPDDAANEYALASWLSYYLWGSMPDDRLFELARKGELRAGLDAEIQRMLRDPRSRTLTEEFAAQWLQFRDLHSLQVDRKTYPDYNWRLRNAMWQENTRFFKDLIAQDRSILRVLDADYTFVNDILAEHYGLADKPGRGFKRVSLADTNRRGMWSQAGVLTVTSHPDRTSPVLRGKFILENLLGMAPPPPPANIPSLSAANDHPTPKDFRESLALHRADPNCASCHNILDPIGLAMEGYDGIGAERDEAAPAETLFDGAVIDSPSALVAYLVETRREEFVATFTEKLATYATGRGVNYRDRPALEQIAAETAAQDYRIGALITAVARHYAPGGAN